MFSTVNANPFRGWKETLTIPATLVFLRRSSLASENSPVQDRLCVMAAGTDEVFANPFCRNQHLVSGKISGQMRLSRSADLQQRIFFPDIPSSPA